ncbi:MAG: methyltransferase [Planctomycetota bacterium]|nr:methyltransferase [Planctomycetota bacterium]
MSAPRALAEPELSRRRLRSIRLPAAGGTYKIVAPDVRADDHGTRPYWAQVWPASIALFRSLLRGPALEGRHAVDLGCGLGLAGLGAGLRGARVTFCDRESEALGFTAFNARALGVAKHGQLVFDWERDALPEDVDLLLLADVAYEYRNIRALRRLADEILERGGEVRLADPDRPTASDLVASLVARGAVVERATAENPDDGGRHAVRLVTARIGLGERR